MAFLLTWHGTLLCRHRHSGALIHRPLLPAVQDDAEPVTLDVAIHLLQPGFSDHVRAAQPKLPVTPPGELRQFQLHWGDDQRTVTLSDGSALLSAEPHGDRTEIFRTEAHGWENFCPCRLPISKLSAPCWARHGWSLHQARWSSDRNPGSTSCCGLATWISICATSCRSIW